MAYMMRDLNAAAIKANEQKRRINSALKGLTDDERAVYIAIEAKLLPFSKVARMLGLPLYWRKAYFLFVFV